MGPYVMRSREREGDHASMVEGAARRGDVGSRPASPTLPHKGRRRAALWTWLPIAIAIVLVAWLALVPLGFLLWQSFLSPETASAAARFTLAELSQPPMPAPTPCGCSPTRCNSRSAARRSLSALGTFFAWINERTDTPFKTLFFALSLVPLIIPGILFTVSWIFLG